MKLERWAHWAEIGASVAVVASLLLLVQQVGQNTRMLERQIALDRATAFNAPFLEESPFPGILTRIKTVDGPEPVEEAFVARYGPATRTRPVGSGTWRSCGRRWSRTSQ